MGVEIISTKKKKIPMSLKINHIYTIQELAQAGFVHFPAKVSTTKVFVREGSVYFFQEENDAQDSLKLLHASTL
jgi:hypothetical protein